MATPLKTIEASGDIADVMRELGRGARAAARALALASPNISPIQRQRYQARLDEVRDYLASTRKRRLSDNGDGQGQQTGQRRGGGR